MSLSAALVGANAALSNAARQVSVVSSNIDGANVPGYARKTLLLQTGADGYAEAVAIGRATEKALQNASMDATTKASGASALSGMYDQLELVLGASSTSNPMALLSNLQNALQQLTSQPSNIAAASGVVEQAQALVDGLHSATEKISSVRQQANDQLGDAATSLNNLLKQFGDVNATIASGYNTDKDINAALDQRDQVLSQISQYVGVSTVQRPDGSMALYTDSGVVMFDGNARKVALATGPLSPGSAGPALTIDGVDVTSASSPMKLKSGTIAALTQARDVVAVNAQSQLDELARNLINVFGEADRSATPSQPTLPGLFTYSGAPSMPGSTYVAGLAGDIQVADSVKQTPLLIRDGGISSSNPAYLANTTGAVDFSDRINELIEAFSSQQTFDTSVAVVGTASLTSFASSAMNVFESDRQKATNSASETKVTQDRATQTLSNATGVNLDDETSKMLEIQRGYQIAAKLITTIDGMFQALLNSTGH
jgi:flagellar hook-associated protein 1 FlgK